MAEPHQLLLVGQPVGHILLRVLAAPNLGGHLDYLLVRASVQRPLEGTDRPCDGRVDVGEGGGDDPRGEGRGVQLVVSVEDEEDVHQAGVRIGGLLPRDHVEEVGGIAEVVLRGDGGPVVLVPVDSRDDRSYPGGDR